VSKLEKEKEKSGGIDPAAFAFFSPLSGFYTELPVTSKCRSIPANFPWL